MECKNLLMLKKGLFEKEICISINIMLKRVVEGFLVKE